MRLLRLALVLLLLAAAGVGTVRADTFAVLPGADAPNRDGGTALPPSLLVPPLVPEVRSPGRLQLLWRAAGDTYGVPWPVLAAINSVESDFGRNMGPSSAGAIGWMQFMPATWALWGVDADGDGVASPWSPEDAVYSAARYLAASGAATDLRGAVFSYNHATWYVDQVLALAAVVERSGPELAFGLDRLAARLAAARAELAAAGAALDEARSQRTITVRESTAAARRAATTARAARTARVAALEARVAAATKLVETLRATAAGASFARATGPALGGPQLVGGYAFPVGGDPATISVPTGHHDYPAVDIAAPAGAPVYALTGGAIERAWSDSDPRCGVGLLLRAADGRGWVYCHLAVLERGIATGSRVAAGDPLGLVGSSGEATGPHLHLQLEPADAWPQREAWFTAFAGSAFRWQAAPSPLFAVVGGPVDVVVFRR